LISSTYVSNNILYIEEKHLKEKFSFPVLSFMYKKKYKKNTKQKKKSLQSGKTSIILTSAVT